MSKQDEIQNDISTHTVMLYMKGTPDEPACGFSAKVVDILETVGTEFGSKNILEDEELRQAIKDFSQWPTIPQLYIKGEFIGGCDVVTELFQTGELERILAE